MLVGVLYFGRFTMPNRGKGRDLTKSGLLDATQTGGVPVGAVMTVITLLGRS